MLKYRYPREGGGYTETLNLEDIPEGVEYEIIEFEPPVEGPIKPNPKTNTGIFEFVFDGTKTVFKIPHYLEWTPDHIFFNFSDGSIDELDKSLRTLDSTDVIFTCNQAPVAGTVTVWWSASLF